MVPPLSNTQIDLSLHFPFFFVEALSEDSLLSHPRETSQVPGPTSHMARPEPHTDRKHKLLLFFPSHTFSECCGRDGHRARRGSEMLSDHPAHLQCNSCSAFTPLAMVFHWFSLLALIILLLYKVRHKASVSFFWFIHFLQTFRQAQARTNKMMNENRHQSDF